MPHFQRERPRIPGTLTTRIYRRRARSKAGGFGGTQLTRVTLAVKQDVATDPADVGLLRPATVVPRSKRIADDVDQLRRARRLAGMLACEAAPLDRSTGCDMRRAQHADGL